LDHFGRHADDGVGRLICVEHHLACRNAHHRKPACLKPRIASCVTLRPITEVVAYSIDLDRKARLRAKEVKHVGPNRVLTAEGWRSWLPLAQSRPQSRFRRGEIATKSPGKSDCFFRRSHGRKTPSTMLRMVPLPRFAWEDNSAAQTRVTVPGAPLCVGLRKSAQAAEDAPGRRS
jgi:hypothetical protein